MRYNDLDSLLIRLACDLEIANGGIRLYLQLWARLDRDEFRASKLRPLARLVGMRPETVSRLLDQLVDGGYLVRSERRAWPGGPFAYRLPATFSETNRSVGNPS